MYTLHYHISASLLPDWTRTEVVGALAHYAPRSEHHDSAGSIRVIPLAEWRSHVATEEHTHVGDAVVLVLLWTPSERAEAQLLESETRRRRQSIDTWMTSTETGVSPTIITAPLATLHPAMLAVLFDRAASEGGLIRSPSEPRIPAGQMVSDCPDGMVLLDAAGRFRFMNEAAEELCGYSASEVIGRSLEGAPFLEPGNRALAVASLEKVQRGQPTSPLEITLLHPDGSRHEVDIRTQLLGPSGDFGAMLQVRDISRRKGVERRLVDSEERFRLLTEVSNEGIVLHEDGRVSDANPRACEILGYPRSVLLGRPSADFLSPESMSAFDEDGRTPEDRAVDVQVRHRSGSWLTLRIQVRPHTHAGRTIQVVTFTDVSSDSREGELQRLTELVLRETDALVFRWENREGSPILFVSDGIHALGYEPHELMTQRVPFESLVHPEDLPHTREIIENRIKGGHQHYHLTYRLLTRTGDERWFEDLTLIDQTGQRSTGDRFGILLDITARRSAEETVRRMVCFDPLTGLPNRTLFRERLEELIDRSTETGQRFGLVQLDLDRFKVVNSSLGLRRGDQLLHMVGARLQSAFGATGVVSRASADEFLVACPGIHDKATAALIGEKIATLFEAPFLLGDHELFVDAACGIAVFPTHGRAHDELLSNAESAMFEVKKDGSRSYAIYEREMTDSSINRLDMEGRLRRAVERDELFLHYQPQVELRTGRVACVEALVRWQHPVQGLMAPSSFIPMAEDTGLIHEIGRWVLHNACNQARRWHDAGLGDFRVAVNISPHQFVNPNLLEEVHRALESAGLAPSFLELELTEGVLMRDIDRGNRTLEELKAMGVNISIDDFGTGYSSLAYLREFPIDTLKIDQGFVRDIAENNSNAAIASALIALSRSLDLDVVAEGVETHAQLEFLRAHECMLLQGYLFSRPLSPAEFEEFMSRARESSELEWSIEDE